MQKTAEATNRHISVASNSRLLTSVAGTIVRHQKSGQMHERLTHLNAGTLLHAIAHRKT